MGGKEREVEIERERQGDREGEQARERESVNDTYPRAETCHVFVAVSTGCTASHKTGGGREKERNRAPMTGVGYY